MPEIDSMLLSAVPELSIPALYTGPGAPMLPPAVNNANHPWFPPIFSQDGWSCGQASGVGYNFTYEINAARGVPGDISGNQYSTHYTWNFYNEGRHDLGVSYYHSFELIRSAGHPDKEDFGEGINYLSWMNGYDKYYNAMHNRLDGVYSIFVASEEGILNLKHWINDHMNGSQVGGVASFYSETQNNTPTVLLPEGTPEAGKHAVTAFGPYAGHAMTIVGYNDSIRYDYNNDGIYTNHLDINEDGLVDLRDREIGGFLFANSFGNQWADSGFCYVMYNAFAGKKPVDGIWNQRVHVLDVRENYQPLLTIKTQFSHSIRDHLKVYAGIGRHSQPSLPDEYYHFDHFNFQGGNHYMQGGTSQGDQTIEVGFDITPLLSHIDPGSESVIYLIFREYDPLNEANGTVHNFSVIDYTQGIIEIPSQQVETDIANNSATILPLTLSVDFNKVAIATEELPVFTPGAPYSFQLSAENGNPPYSWAIDRRYLQSVTACEYPTNPGDKIIDYNGTEISKEIELDFDFPFYGQDHSKVYVHSDGFINFNGYELPVPYQTDDRIVFNIDSVIGPCIHAPFYINTANGNAVWYRGDDEKAIFSWHVSHDIGSAETQTLEFSTVLHHDGHIDFHYTEPELFLSQSWTSGISGGDRRNTTLSNVLKLAECSGPARIRFEPPFLPPQATITGSGHFTCLPGNENRIYTVPFMLTDDLRITSTRKLQFTGNIAYELQTDGNEGFLGYGDTVLLNLTVRNAGAQTVGIQSIGCSSASEHIVMIDSAANGIILDPGETVDMEGAFSLITGHFVPDMENIRLETYFDLEAKTLSGYNHFRAHAPYLEISGISVQDGNDNRLSPGETGDLTVHFRNKGHAPVSGLEVHPFFPGGTVTINDHDPDVGDIGSGQTEELTINVTVPSSMPEGYLPLGLDLYWEPAFIRHEEIEILIGRFPCCVANLSAAGNSGQQIDSCIRNLDVPVRYLTHLPEDIGNYHSVFLCLGQVFGNYTLTESQGEMLHDYLLSGGNLYLEGGPTWSADPQTAVHPLFHIQPETLPWQEYDSLRGGQGSFAEGLIFGYDHEKPYFNLDLEPLEQAFTLFHTLPSQYSCIVANDAGEYMTIASQADFGSMAAGDHPSQKDTLIARYLEFFGITTAPVAGMEAGMETATRSLHLDAFPNPFSKETRVRFKLEKEGVTDLYLFNIKGMVAHRLIENMPLKAGNHEFVLGDPGQNRSSLPCGIYICVLRSNGLTESVKLIRY